MDSLDRALTEIADSRRPASPPALDDLLARARAGRRRTAGLGVVACLGALTIGLLQLGGSAPKRDVVLRSGPSPTAAAACHYVTGNAIYEYVDFVKVGGVTLTHGFGAEPYPAVHPENLGGIVGTVHCRLADTDGRARTDNLADGTSSFLAIGTPLYAVKGYDPACRVAARMDGKLQAYLALDDKATVALAEPCAVGPPKGEVLGGLQTTAGPGGGGAQVSGTVVFTAADGKVTSVKVDHGFHLWLAPGEYDVTGTSPQYKSGGGTCHALRRVTVVALAPVGVVVLCMLS
jgi:hypothetical protein